MNKNPIFWTMLMLAAVPLRGQEKAAKDAGKPSSVPTHKSEQSALNALKQDGRSKDGLKKAMEMVEEAAGRNEAVRKETERLVGEKKQGLPDLKGVKDLEGLKKAAGELKKGQDGGSLDALKDVAREAREAMGEDAKDALRTVKDKVMKKKDGTPAVTAAPTRPATFAGVPGPAPLNPNRKVNMAVSSVIDADEMIKPPARDPANPDKALPPGDPRTRTYILRGNAKVRGKSFAADGDEIEILYDESHAGDPTGGMAKSSGKSGKPKTVDPVSTAGGTPAEGKPKTQESPFERIIIRGRARIMAVGKDGEVQVGRAGYMVYEKKTGLFFLREWPEAQTGDKCFAAESKESVIMLSQTEEVQFKNCTMLPVERSIGADEFPKSLDKPVPATTPDRNKATGPARAAQGSGKAR
jgi:hypothetical protein